MKKILTNTFIFNNQNILLGLKLKGFGIGLWNGFGGKVEHNEYITAAAIRECQEEACITPINITKTGIINFLFQGQNLEVHYFRAHTFTGTPTTTEEMQPQWFTYKEIPYNHMWQDDPYWMPLMLSENFFYAHFEFNDSDSIKKYTLSHVPIS